MPVTLCQKQEGWNAVDLLRLEQRDGLRLDRVTELPSLAVVVITAPSERHGLSRIRFGQQVHHKSGITQSAHCVDSRRQLETDVVCVELTIPKAGKPLQRFDAFRLAPVKTAESLQQPATVGAGQWRHVGNGANAKQITCHLN